MAQENKIGYVEGSIDRDAQIHFENHCDVSKAIPLAWMETSSKG